MRHEVSQRVKDETTECRYAFACLKTGRCGDRPMCEAEEAHGYCLLTIKSYARPACPYRMPFGKVQFCRCPVHFALYQQREQ